MDTEIKTLANSLVMLQHSIEFETDKEKLLRLLNAQHDRLVSVMELSSKMRSNVAMRMNYIKNETCDCEKPIHRGVEPEYCSICEKDLI